MKEIDDFLRQLLKRCTDAIGKQSESALITVHRDDLKLIKKYLNKKKK